MPWEIPSEDIEPEKIDWVAPEPGRYHVQVNAVDEDAIATTGSPQMAVDYEILGGTTPGMEGREFRDYFYRSAAAINRVLLFALATRLTTMEELERAKATRTSPTFDFNRVVGRQLCIELDKEEYPTGSGKFRSKCGFGIYATDSPKAKGIPLNATMLAKIGDTADDPFAGDPPDTKATRGGVDGTPGSAPFTSPGGFFD